MWKGEPTCGGPPYMTAQTAKPKVKRPGAMASAIGSALHSDAV